MANKLLESIFTRTWLPPKKSQIQTNKQRSDQRVEKPQLTSAEHIEQKRNLKETEK